MNHRVSLRSILRFTDIYEHFRITKVYEELRISKYYYEYFRILLLKKVKIVRRFIYFAVY